MCPLLFLNIHVVLIDLQNSSISLTAPFVDMVLENSVYEWSLFCRSWCAEEGNTTKFYTILS